MPPAQTSGDQRERSKARWCRRAKPATGKEHGARRVERPAYGQFVPDIHRGLYV